jgi:hypothetical protein
VRAPELPPRCAQEPRLKPMDYAPRSSTRAWIDGRIICVALCRRRPSQSTPIRPSPHRQPRLYPSRFRFLRQESANVENRTTASDGSTPLSRSGRMRGRQKDTKTVLNGRRSWPTAWNCGHRQKDDRGRRPERARLRALQLPNDVFKALDLTVPCQHRRYVTHKMPQTSRFARQISRSSRISKSTRIDAHESAQVKRYPLASRVFC